MLKNKDRIQTVELVKSVREHLKSSGLGHVEELPNKEST